MDERATEDWSRAREINRAHWDDLALFHGQDEVYDTQGLIAGRSSLKVEEEAAIRDAVGEVAGLDVLHVQCHIGFDTITLARRGARVTGLDFSAASLAKARDLAQACGVEIRWVQADSTDLPPHLAEGFDLAYATIGVLCWIGDLGAWMRSVHAALRPGGQLVLVDTHPLQEMIDTPEPLVLDMPYANDGGHRFDIDGSYADPTAKLAHPVQVCYAHSLGETVSAAAAAGLRIDALTEHLESSFHHRRDIPRQEDDGRWRLRIGGQPLPLLFTLRATRPS